MTGTKKKCKFLEQRVYSPLSSYFFARQINLLSAYFHMCIFISQPVKNIGIAVSACLAVFAANKSIYLLSTFERHYQLASEANPQ